MTAYSIPKVGIRCHEQPNHPPHLYNVIVDSKLSYSSPLFVILANIMNGFIATIGYTSSSAINFFPAKLNFADLARNFERDKMRKSFASSSTISNYSMIGFIFQVKGN